MYFTYLFSLLFLPNWTQVCLPRYCKTHLLTLDSAEGKNSIYFRVPGKWAAGVQKTQTLRWLSVKSFEGQSLRWEGFPGSSADNGSACNAGGPGSIPGYRRPTGEGIGYPLQYSGLENSMDCIVCGVAKSQTRMSYFHFHLEVRVAAHGLSSDWLVMMWQDDVSGISVIDLLIPTSLGAVCLWPACSHSSLPGWGS